MLDRRPTGAEPHSASAPLAVRWRLPNWWRELAWWLWTLGLSAGFVRLAAIDLANVRTVSADDSWLMSASYKLATAGVFGSDLYAGFFHAEQHYFFALPIQHLLQALAFRVAGAGMAQARAVSLVAGVAVVWLAGRLAYRWYGLAVAMLTVALLVGWRSWLVGLDLGMPLLSVVRSARYDITPVAFAWLAILLLDRLLCRPGWLAAAGLGAVCGCAALTQFTGAFVIPLVALAWGWQRGRQVLADRLTYAIGGGLALALAPYMLYIARYRDDFVAQTATLYPERSGFGRPSFYLANLLREPARFANLPGHALPGPWPLLIGIAPTLALLCWRARGSNAVRERLLLLSIAVFWGLLGLIEETKAPIYSIILMPSLCMLLALGSVELMRWSWRSGHALLRYGIGAIVLAAYVAVVAEGAATYVADQRIAQTIPTYLAEARRFDLYLRPADHILGPERWWWALHAHPYVAINNLMQQASAAKSTGRPAPTIAEQVARYGADVVILTEQVQSDLQWAPADAQRQFAQVIGGCSVGIARWRTPFYGLVEIYRLNKDAGGRLICRAS